MEDINIPNDELHLRMWADLRARDDARTLAEEAVDEAALLYFGLGLSVEAVLHAIRLSEPEWLARLAASSERRDAMRAAVLHALRHGWDGPG